MKPYLYIAAVIVMFLVGDRLGALFLGNIVASSHFRYSEIYRGGLNYDVLVIGDSRAVHSVFAPEFDKDTCRSVYNASYNGMSGELAEAVVMDYLAHNAPPKVVLIEVSNAFMNPDLLGEMRPFVTLDGGSRLQSLIDKLRPWDRVWSSISHLYTFDNEMMLRAAYYFGHNDQGWIVGGPPMSPSVVANLRRETWTLKPISMIALVSLGHELRERGIEPVFFVAPFHPAFHNLVTGYDEGMRQVNEALREFPMIDMSRTILPNSDFADLLHTNIFGSRVVMAALAKEIDRSLGNRCARSEVP